MAKGKPMNQIDEQSLNAALDAAKARVMMIEEKKVRAQVCMDEIQKALKMHNCDLRFVEVRVNGQPQQVMFETVALDMA